MDKWGVTVAGYRILKRTGLGKRMDDNWRAVRDLLPHGAFLDYAEAENFLDKTPNIKPYSERKKAIKEWMDAGDMTPNPTCFP